MSVIIPTTRILMSLLAFFSMASPIVLKISMFFFIRSLRSIPFRGKDRCSSSDPCEKPRFSEEKSRRTQEETRAPRCRVRLLDFT